MFMGNNSITNNVVKDKNATPSHVFKITIITESVNIRTSSTWGLHLNLGEVFFLHARQMIFILPSRSLPIPKIVGLLTRNILPGSYWILMWKGVKFLRLHFFLEISHLKMVELPRLNGWTRKILHKFIEQQDTKRAMLATREFWSSTADSSLTTFKISLQGDNTTTNLSLKCKLSQLETVQKSPKLQMFSKARIGCIVHNDIRKINAVSMC